MGALKSCWTKWKPPQTTSCCKNKVCLSAQVQYPKGCFKPPKKRNVAMNCEAKGYGFALHNSGGHSANKRMTKANTQIKFSNVHVPPLSGSGFGNHEKGKGVKGHQGWVRPEGRAIAWMGSHQ